MTAPTPLRPELPPLTPRLKRLPIDHRGYPVPFFVAYVDGVPDHRIIDPAKIVHCVKENLCWLCGERLGTYIAFVIGPMCAVNRISGEPPEHRECAEYAVKACPFLSRPQAHRREAGKPEEAEMSENALQRNPGISLVWVTKSYEMVRDSGSSSGKPLFRIGEPLACISYAQGRIATEEEIAASFDSGLPALEGLARAEGAAAQRALRDQVGVARRLLKLAAA